MPQDSLLYAIGRLRMLRRRLLSAAQMQRLLTAQDYEEAQKLLLEAGYVSPEQPDAERASVDRMLAAARMLKRLSPEPPVTDSFLMRYDANNLKILLKARMLGEEPEGLSPAGTMNPEVLRHAVADHSYGKLPQPFSEAMDALEKRIISNPDPMMIDVALDKALYQLMAAGVKHSSSKTPKRWMQMKADYANLRAYLRLKEMQEAPALDSVLLPGGQLTHQLFLEADAHPDRLVRQLHKLYGTDIARLTRAALDDRAALIQLEKRMDEDLQGLFAPHSMEPEHLDAVIDYLMRVEKESAAVRLIMAGKRNRFTPEQIEERLRRGYGA